MGWWGEHFGLGPWAHIPMWHTRFSAFGLCGSLGVPLSTSQERRPEQWLVSMLPSAHSYFTFLKLSQGSEPPPSLSLRRCPCPRESVCLPASEPLTSSPLPPLLPLLTFSCVPSALALFPLLFWHHDSVSSLTPCIDSVCMHVQREHS